MSDFHTKSFSSNLKTKVNLEYTFEDSYLNAMSVKLKSIISKNSISAFPSFQIQFKPEKDKLDVRFEKDKFLFNAILNDLFIKDFEINVLFLFIFVEDSI